MAGGEGHLGERMGDVGQSEELLKEVEILENGIGEGRECRFSQAFQGLEIWRSGALPFGISLGIPICLLFPLIRHTIDTALCPNSCSHLSLF